MFYKNYLDIRVTQSMCLFTLFKQVANLPGFHFLLYLFGYLGGGGDDGDDHDDDDDAAADDDDH